MVQIDPAALKDFAAGCYRALKVPDVQAELIAGSLVQADLWGHRSHGVLRVFWYGKRLQSGATVPDARPVPDRPGAALTTMDGQNGPGQVAAQAAMDHAIAAARANGIGAVAVRNSGHFGTAMYFTRQAAAAGCIGFLCTNASPAMAPWGGREKRVGNNPWSWSAPAGRHPPMMLDIANTAVARGKLYDAKARGTAIPEGWAIDAQGNATTDPDAGIAGTLLPMAGHKGYCISTMMDVVSGVLSGSAFGPDVTGPYSPEGRSGVGHLALAIDIEACRPLAEFNADMERMIATLRATPLADGTTRIFYTGEREAESEIRLRANGIDLPDATAKELRTEAARLGIVAPF